MKFYAAKKTLFLVLTLAALPLAAQNAPKTFDPFVSQLQGEAKNNLVQLSWVDSLDVEGPVYIYRSIYPFGGNNSLLVGTPVEIPYGRQSYTDVIDTVGTFYYFAVASDISGLRYDLPINSKNTVTIHVPGGLELNQETGVLSLEITAQEDRVIITFAEKDVKNVALYRSTKPIYQVGDLEEAALIQTKITSPFIDYPVPGIPYYYALITEEDLVRETLNGPIGQSTHSPAAIVPGRNSTKDPVELPSGRPEFYSDGSSTGSALLPLVSVQTATRWIDSSMESPPPEPVLPPQPKKPRAFVRDLEALPEGGDEYALVSVVRGPFADRNWEAARIEFIKFIALPGSLETKIRAKFYLGQCYYFLNEPREGLSEFLSIRDKFPIETEEWIQALIGIMGN